MTYPDGEQVTYDYPSAGGMAPVPRPSEIDVGYQGGQSVSASGVSYFPDGVVASLSYGNAVHWFQNQYNEPVDDSSGYPEDPASLHFFPRLDLMPSDSTSGSGAVDPGWIVGRVCEPSDDSIAGGGGADLSANHSYGGGDP